MTTGDHRGVSQDATLILSLAIEKQLPRVAELAACTLAAGFGGLQLADLWQLSPQTVAELLG